MLSYMVPSPIEDKPPVSPTVSNKNGLQLVLDTHIAKNGDISVSNSILNGNAASNVTQKKIIKSSTIASAGSSNSSLNSSTDIPSVHGCMNSSASDKPRTRIANGASKTTLKRVSFGSSKGSMVETLIYETPVQEEPEPIQPLLRQVSEKTDETDSFTSSEGVKVPSSKVRVSFFESGDKKYVLSAPDSFGNQSYPENFVIYEQFVMSSPAQSHNATIQYSYDRQESTDSGWDNPFRPDGDLSKEADEIVELIKEGKPITPTQTTNPGGKLPEENGSAVKQSVSGSNAANKANGSAPTDNSVVTGVEVQHCTTAKPTDASQVEHVVIKKKSKCKCCTIQ